MERIANVDVVTAVVPGLGGDARAYRLAALIEW